jgi:hypothetical protein
MEFLYMVEVEFAIRRPPSPFNLRKHVISLMAIDDHDAHLGAAHWIDSRPGVVMCTETKILEVEL